MRDWVATVESSHYCLGSVMGPHPYPWMVREFHRVIGVEAAAAVRRPAGRPPDVVVACVGGVPTRPASSRLRRGARRRAGRRGARRGAAIGRGVPGIVHGMHSYLKQDEFGQVLEAESISAGLDYPASARSTRTWPTWAGPATSRSPTTRSSTLPAAQPHRGDHPALESAHAPAWVSRARAELAGRTVLINLSGGATRTWRR